MSASALWRVTSSSYPSDLALRGQQGVIEIDLQESLEDQRSQRRHWPSLLDCRQALGDCKRTHLLKSGQ